MSGLFRAMYFIIGAFCGPLFAGYILHLFTYPVLFIMIGVQLLFQLVYIGLVNLCKPDLFLALEWRRVKVKIRIPQTGLAPLQAYPSPFTGAVDPPDTSGLV